MQSENFDNRIKDSLNQRPPGNETPEWPKMETLLDHHMPVDKKDRRKIFLVLFFFLLLGGGAFIVWKTNSGEHKIAAKPTTESSAPDQQGATDNSSRNKIPGSGSTVNENPQNKSNETSTSQKIDQSSVQEEPGTTQKSDKTVLTGTEKTTGITVPKGNTNQIAGTKDTRRNSQLNKPTTQKPGIDDKPISSAEKNSKKDNISAIADNKQQKPDESQKVPDTQKPEEVKKTDAEKTSEEQKQVKPAESQPTLTANSKKQKQQNRSSLFNNLFFTVSAGPDISTVGISDPGKIRPVIGAGIGYQISKKFAVRTGFYSARKVYTADPYDYHPPYNVWTAYPNLKSIDANCKVYEIPVTIDYTISQNKKRGWFVSAGLSSLLMKEEIYGYNYKPNSSPTYITYTRRIHDQNKHYFSVLNLSGGYTRTINKNFSLRVEPYAKFALGGVGYGKVDLNSGGVLISAIIKPFARK